MATSKTMKKKKQSDQKNTLSKETDFICKATRRTRMIWTGESRKSEVLVCLIINPCVKVWNVVYRVRVLSTALFLEKNPFSQSNLGNPWRGELGVPLNLTASKAFFEEWGCKRTLTLYTTNAAKHKKQPLWKVHVKVTILIHIGVLKMFSW